MSPNAAGAPRFEVPDGQFAERVRASFARQRAMALFGARMSEVGPGTCEIRLPYNPDLTQQHGYVHGGVVGAIADSAAGYAGMSLCPSGTDVLTVEYKLNLLSPAGGDVLIAKGRVVRAGRTLMVSSADVFSVEGGRERLCATLLQTLMPKRDDEEG